MRRHWQPLISVALATFMGWAFYQLLGHVVYTIRGTTWIPRSEPLLAISGVLTLIFTAAGALAISAVLKRAFGSR